MTNKAPEKPKGTVRILHITDTHLWPHARKKPVLLRRHDDAAWNAIWEGLKHVDCDAVFWTGDIATAQDKSAYLDANRHLVPLGTAIPSGVRTARDPPVPVFAVPGNHDHYSLALRLAIYLRSTSVFRRRFANPYPSVHHWAPGVGSGREFFIFRIDSSSGIGAQDTVRYAPGRLARDDLDIVRAWTHAVRRGGLFDGKQVDANRLRMSWNVLLMHHDLHERLFLHDFEGDDSKILLKFIATLPIHVVACGHIHEPASPVPYGLFGKGRLDPDQRRALRKRGYLRADHVLISRPGTTCLEGASRQVAHILDFGDHVTIRPGIFDRGAGAFVW